MDTATYYNATLRKYAPEMITIQCAWCHEVKIGGRYTPLGLNAIVHEIDLPSKSGKTIHYEVSHGICDPCKERMLGHSLAA